MNVKLVSITNPTIEGVAKPEDLVAYCARVSNPSNQLNTETSPKLLSFCIKHGHWSVFEMVDMTVEIKTSRAIAAQILRHRSFSFQEFSQRYSQVQELEPLELRKQADKNRQSSSEVITDEEINTIAKLILNGAVEVYESLLSKGVSKESARMVLPLGIQTTMYMKGSLRSWIHYINLRTEQNTQKEHREVAEEAKKIFIENFPSISQALNWST